MLSYELERVKSDVQRLQGQIHTKADDEDLNRLARRVAQIETNLQFLESGLTQIQADFATLKERFESAHPEIL